MSDVTAGIIEHVQAGTSGQSSNSRLTVDRIDNRPTSKPLELLEADQRFGIARWLVTLYATLLVFSLVAPMALLWLPKSANSFGVGDVRDVMQTLSASMASLVGILGFVVGYYFKASEKPSSMERTKPPRRKSPFKRAQ